MAFGSHKDADSRRFINLHNDQQNGCIVILPIIEEFLAAFMERRTDLRIYPLQYWAKLIKSNSLYLNRACKYMENKRLQSYIIVVNYSVSITVL